MCSLCCLIVKCSLLRVQRQMGQIYLMYTVGGLCSSDLYYCWCIAQFSFVINATTTAIFTSGCEARAHPGAQVRDSGNMNCRVLIAKAVAAWLVRPFCFSSSSPVSWIKKGPMAGQIWCGGFRDFDRCEMENLSLPTSNDRSFPAVLAFILQTSSSTCVQGLFFQINSQLFIQGEMSSLHNIFSSSLFMRFIDGCFSVPLPGTLLFHLHFLCFLVSSRCWGSAENGRRFSSPHGPQYGDRCDPCSGKLCSSAGHGKDRTKKRQRRNDRLRGSLRWQNMEEEPGMLMMSRTR